MARTHVVHNGHKVLHYGDCEGCGRKVNGHCTLYCSISADTGRPVWLCQECDKGMARRRREREAVAR